MQLFYYLLARYCSIQYSPSLASPNSPLKLTRVVSRAHIDGVPPVWLACLLLEGGPVTFIDFLPLLMFKFIFSCPFPFRLPRLEGGCHQSACKKKHLACGECPPPSNAIAKKLRPKREREKEIKKQLRIRPSKQKGSCRCASPRLSHGASESS